MTRDMGLTPANMVRPLALAIAALMASATVQAEPLFQVPLYNNADMSRYSDNYVELGGAWNSANSYNFGQWTGMTKDGGYVLGNFHWNNRNAANSRDYFDVLGTNLGFDSRYVGASYTSQGRWSVNASYQGIPNNEYDTTRFIYGNLGGTNLNALTSVVGAGTANPNNVAAGNPARLNAAAQYFDIDTKRDIWKIGGKGLFGPGLSLDVTYRQDNRDGNKLGYGAFFQGGGNPRSTALAIPTNDTTNQVEATLGWQGATAQAQLNYWWSRYSNDNSSLTWQNPFVNVTGWPGGQGYPNSFGQMSLYPNNTYNQISATGAWNFARTWRAYGTLSYGRGTQDQGFQPYFLTVAPPIVTTALPQGNLDGRVDRYLADLGLVGRPMDKLTLRFKYRYDETDNKTGTAGYFGSWGSIVQNGTATTNVPYGYLAINSFSVNGDYAVARGASLGAGYQYKYTKYKYEDRSNTTDNIFRLEYRQVANEFATGGLRYTYQVRTGSDVETVNPTTLAVQVIPYFLNNYTQNRVRAFVDLTPMETVGLNLSVDWINRSYSNPDSSLNCSTFYAGPPAGPTGSPGAAGCYGLEKASWTTATADLQWRPIEKVNGFLFYTYGDLANEQVDKQFNNGATLVSPYTAWNATLKTRSNTVGTGASFNPNGDIDVGVTYIYNWGQQSTALASAPVATTATPFPGLGTQAPLPSNEYRLNSLQLFAKYKVNKNWALRANYWYEQLSSSDWAYDNVQVFSSDRTVFAAQSAPRYSNSVFGLSVSYTGF